MTEDLENWIDARLAPQIKGKMHLRATSATYAHLPEVLHPLLQEALAEQGITQLYQHQATAFQYISEKQNTIIASRTSSGKTLSFLLPILNDYLSCTERFSVLLLYPTKALSRDQENSLSRLLCKVVQEKRIGTFDGDTPREERAKLEQAGDFILTNPDMLHSGILPNHHRRWKSFLARLKYIVVDEVHTYRGAFGSHVANVFLRLQRICELNNSRPIYIASSATIGNPTVFAEALFNQQFTLVEGNDAPQPPRLLYALNPELFTTASGTQVRKGPSSTAIPLIREAMQKGVRTIVFCRARQEVERLYRAITEHYPELASLIQPYRGGLLPHERRQLENRLFTGKLLGIITTSALELGIDIGDLDLCIQLGYPGSVSSFWQRAGRVGRRGQRAIIAFIAREAPIDQYIIHHSDFITNTSIEKAWLSSHNPYILLQHLPCAANEIPITNTDAHYPLQTLQAAIGVLVKQKTLAPIQNHYHYTLPDYPTRGVHLRGMSHTNIDILCNDEVIGEIDPIGARGTLYKDAIYQHLGRKYISLDLDLDQKICRVAPIGANYFTEAVWEHDTSLTQEVATHTTFANHWIYGFIHVKTQPKLYKKIRERSYENVGYGPITLAPFEYNTMGFCLLPSAEYKTWLQSQNKFFFQSALLGLAHILRKIAPAWCLAASGDIQSDLANCTWNSEVHSALYLYDTIEGGVGYAEKIYEAIHECLLMCHHVIESCDCQCGCPACIPSLPEGVEAEEHIAFLSESNAATECTKSLLLYLLYGKQVSPLVKKFLHALPQDVDSFSPDPEAEMLAQKLSLAEKSLSQKRQHLH